MNRLRQAWWVLTGRVDLPSRYISCINELNHKLHLSDQRIFELERDNQLARAGIAELKGKFHQLGGEEKIKAASDAITNSIIDDMIRNPNKYVPKAD